MQTAPAAPSKLPGSTRSRPELLAPAGDWEAMRAAVVNGADAVYFGLNQFNARHRAHNFTLEELPEVMAYLHGHNVRGYVAFNILIFSDELEEAARFISAVGAAGVDAVIVQDLGLTRLIQRLCPKLPVHGSTQMTLTEPMGIEFVKALGVQRVILARELSIADIRKIHQPTAMPVEVFVHGALCVAYSGQCLTSESLGGRSANRGQCAQACRLPYSLIVDRQQRDLGEHAYLLSPQDLASYDLIDQLADSGVCSLKIEGRLKGAPYVAATTQTYRAAIDALETGRRFELPRQQETDLAQTFSRGFTHGFLDGVDHQELVHARFPKSRGLLAGQVVAITPRGVLVELAASNRSKDEDGFTRADTLNVGDGVVFDQGHPEAGEQGGRIATVRTQGGNKSARVEIAFERDGIDLDQINVGDIVWKTDDPASRRRLETSYSRDRVVHREPIDVQVMANVDQPLMIRVRDEAGHEATVSSDAPLQRAQKHPLTEATFREQFGRLGDTPFELRRVTGQENGCDAMVPKSVLNELRRRAVDILLEQRKSEQRSDVTDADALARLRSSIDAKWKDAFTAPAQPQLHVLVRSLDQLDAVLDWRNPATGTPVDTVYCDFEDVRKYKQAVASARLSCIPIGLATVRIIKPGEEGLLGQLAANEPDLLLVRNLAGLTYFKQRFAHIPLVADYAMNIANELTATIMAENGVRRMVPSYDLNWKQLCSLLGRFPAAAFEAVVHQHMPMFHMEHCVFAHTLSDGSDYRTCGRPCDHHQVELRDRAGAAHALVADVGCRNTVFNAAAQSAAEFLPRMKELGLRHFRVELLREIPEESKQLLDRYARVIAGMEDGRATWRQLRVLNQLGVTRGTLE